jgi:hypothetical protein
MIKYKDVLTKPDALTSWNKALTTDILNYIQVNYVLTGKFICHVGVFTDTTQSTTLIFSSQETFDEYFNDPFMSEWHAAKANYNTANSIVRSKVSIETIDESDPEYINNNMIHILKTKYESPIDIGEFIESV